MKTEENSCIQAHNGPPACAVFVPFRYFPSSNITSLSPLNDDFLCKLDLAFNNVKPNDWYFVLDLV